ncbi:HD-GYP domain-containing protein [Clostridium sp. Marseille-P2415]|uniref:HD-GYP domain-containing protein n=1 Tax=Clostridium sp. Marseille-P2415 TaxID=1805471 RepID=UPI0009884195|nr:HD-GYP domain-containing protein [Clostridium sp. Marseille-P2415]
MIYLPIEKLTEGMELARNIPGLNPMLPFAVTGFILNERMICRMKKIGIQGAYIRTELTEGIEPEDFVEPELKAKMLTSIRNTFDQNLKKITFQSSKLSYEEIAAVAESVVMNILSKDKYLFQMIDIRDYDGYTYSHSLYVGILSVLLGRFIGLPTSHLYDLALCGLLHDIGKTDIPIDITNKPGPLTNDEFEIMKQHPSLSYKKLGEHTIISQVVLRGVQTHHEKFDGSGYPFGLTGDNIPLYGRILAIADVYDALNSTRPYRKAWSPRRIFDYLTSCSNTHFDPELLTAFLQCVTAYPIGTIIHLSDGSTAVVKDNTPGFALRPTIRIIGPAPKAGTDIDLSCESLNLTIVDIEDI